MEIENHIRCLISKYYHGLLDDESAVELAAWVSSSDKAAEMFRAELRVLEESENHAIQSADFFKKIPERRKISEHGRRRVVSFACAIAVLVAIIVPISFFVRQPVPQSASADVQGENPGFVQTFEEKTPVIRTTAVARTYVAPKTGIMPLTLADCTRIILNRGARLVVDGEFGHSTRTVSLDGEAWFEVAKNPAKPFRILCGHEEFIVRGTSFNIVSYSTDNFSVVTLHSGSLEARVKDDTLLLDPGDELRIDDEDDNINRRKVDVRRSVRWMDDGALHFTSLPLKYVAAQIGHKYDVRIRVHSSIANIVYDGDIDKESLDVALKLLSITSPVKLDITNLDGEYYITKHNNL